MPVFCLALNKERILSEADITKQFLIELVVVTDRWEIYVPTAGGAVPLQSVGEAERITATLQGNELECADNEAIDPILGSTISQAIRADPRIGRTWVVEVVEVADCEGAKKFLFTLFAAVNARTQKVQITPDARTREFQIAPDARTREPQIAPYFWYSALAIAKQKLAGIEKERKNTYNQHCPSTEQEKSAISEGGYGPHILDDYHYRLMQLEMAGRKRLEKAKYMEQVGEPPV